MLFCKVDYRSVLTLVNCIDSFSQASCLAANSAKSAIYIAGVSPHMGMELTSITQFPLGKLPFRYLGVPLSSKHLFATDCDALVDKMTSRIKSWSEKSLSYIARLQLVNSVLMNISSYWCQIFILPKKVINMINSICRSFLGFGVSDSSKP